MEVQEQAHLWEFCATAKLRLSVSCDGCLSDLAEDTQLPSAPRGAPQPAGLLTPPKGLFRTG